MAAVASAAEHLVLAVTPLPGGRTRLVTRLRIHLDWRHPLISLLTVVLNEFGDFAMMRRMLLGIRDRAEAVSGCGGAG